LPPKPFNMMGVEALRLLFTDKNNATLEVNREGVDV
jgi:hypothetical protein